MSKPDEVTYTSEHEQIIDILSKTIEALRSPGNVAKLQEARDNIGNEMMKMMQFLFPIVMTVQMEVLQDCGYATGKEGLVKFVKCLKNAERDEPEVARLHACIKAYYLPPVTINTNNDCLVEDVINSC